MEQKSQISKFQIIRGKDPDVLTTTINNLLAAGWTLSGETFYIKESGLICQAVTIINFT